MVAVWLLENGEMEMISCWGFQFEFGAVVCSVGRVEDGGEVVWRLKQLVVILLEKMDRLDKEIEAALRCGLPDSGKTFAKNMDTKEVFLTP